MVGASMVIDSNAQPGTSVVLGLGVTGVACVRWLLAMGDRVIAMDSRPQPPGLAEVRALQANGAMGVVAPTGRPHARAGAGNLEVVAGAFRASCLDDADRLVLSPGIPLDEPFLREARQRGIEMLSDIDLFARHTHSRLIAITGTNGKSTVTSLVVALLQASGRCSVAAGNIGKPVLELVMPRPSPAGAGGVAVPFEAAEPEAEFVALELSSFQLERSQGLTASVGAFLNIAEDHLDHHGTFAAYLAAKQRVFEGAACAVVLAEQRDLVSPPVALPCVTFSATGAADYHLCEHAGGQWLARHHEPLLATGAMRLRGSHNHANALAALAITEAVLDEPLPAAALQALADYAGLPHRMQHVRRRGAVDWINDSKATNPGAAVAAVRGLATPVVLIAGGRGKGADFRPLAEALSGRARAAVLFGEEAARLATTLAGACEIHRADDLAVAVDLAARLARPGDTVLFAPACASFDMFANYRQRGDAFAQLVEALP
jgi:UDP-N-acetylmuramoylalanine--D-glutamate ligase